MYTEPALQISRILYYVGGKLVKAYSKLMFRMSINSHSLIPTGAKIIVANHPTTTDPFILTSISNGQAAVLIKDVLFDVPMAIAILQAAKIIDMSQDFINETLFLGELALDGNIRPVCGVLSIAHAAIKMGKKRLIIL